MSEIPHGWKDWLTDRRGAGSSKKGGVIQNLPAYIRGKPRGMVERALANLREPTAAIEDVVAALEAIPNPDLGWDAWNRVLMAAWAATEGSEAGMAAAITWSAKSRKHDKEAVAERWAHYARSPPTEIGFGALVWAAREAVPGWEMPSRRPRPAGGAPAAGKEMNGHAHAENIFGEAVAGDAIIFPDKTEGGRLKPTCQNARIATTGFGAACEHDAFHERFKIGGQAMNEWVGELTDEVVQKVRMMIFEKYNFDPGTNNTRDALIQQCLMNSFHPIKDYFKTLQWDGVRRLDRWMSTYLGAEDTAFNRAVARLSLVAAVRRILQPGCKFDHIIVLESPEGRGKSSAIEILAGTENFSDQTILSLDDRGQQEAVQGVWLYEIADLAGHSRAEVERVKAFASRTRDRARPAYGRCRVDKARTCVFFGTTNNDQYLKSQTGNRRFLPVLCGRVELEALNRDRDQIWAEALAAEKEGKPLFLAQELWGEAAQIQDARREHDPWDDILAGNLGGFVHQTATGFEWRVASQHLFETHLQITREKQNDVAAKRLAFVMRRNGWEGPKNIRSDGVPCKGYFKVAVAADWALHGVHKLQRK